MREQKAARGERVIDIIVNYTDFFTILCFKGCKEKLIIIFSNVKGIISFVE